LLPVSITKSINVDEIPESSEVEEGPQATPRKDEHNLQKEKWDRNSKMPP